MTGGRLGTDFQFPGRRLRAGLFAAFASVSGLWLVLGVIDDLVWMPQLTAPSIPSERISAVLSKAGSAPGVVIAPVLPSASGVCRGRRRPASARR